MFKLYRALRKLCLDFSLVPDGMIDWARAPAPQTKVLAHAPLPGSECNSMAVDLLSWFVLFFCKSNLQQSANAAIIVSSRLHVMHGCYHHHSSVFTRLNSFLVLVNVLSYVACGTASVL